MKNVAQLLNQNFGVVLPSLAWMGKQFIVGAALAASRLLKTFPGERLRGERWQCLGRTRGWAQEREKGRLGWVRGTAG